jgi:hypothetical protein
MTKIVVEDATCIHTGTVCSGSVAGTISVGSNGFVRTETRLVMVDDGTLIIPSHLNPPCTPGTLASHNFTPDTLAQSFVTVEGHAVVLEGDSYSSDPTTIDSAGSNSFVEVN